MKWLGIIFLYALSGTLFAQPVASDLIKVAPETDANCVEYYRYQGELYCSTKPLTSNQAINPSIKEDETLIIPFDERPWQIAWAKDDPTLRTIEYVPQGDDINNWTELVTSQFFPGLQNKLSLNQFMELTVTQLKEAGFNPIINVISNTPNQLIFEFRIEAPANQRQDELQMITKDNKGIYVLHYVIKSSDMGEANRDKWIRILQASRIK